MCFFFNLFHGRTIFRARPRYECEFFKVDLNISIMKKTILICTVMVALAAMTITSCISWKKINLSDEPFCKTPIVRAEIQNAS